MEILLIIIGIIIGIVFEKIKTNMITEIGTIDIDHSNGLCKLNVTSDQLSDLTIERVVFNVNHNASISREEQSL